MAVTTMTKNFKIFFAGGDKNLLTPILLLSLLFFVAQTASGNTP